MGALNRRRLCVGGPLIIPNSTLLIFPSQAAPGRYHQATDGKVLEKELVMKIRPCITAFSLVLAYVAIADTPKLQKVKAVEVSPALLSGYSFESDQAFKISSGPLANKLIFFASRDSSQNNHSIVPQFVVVEGKVVIDHQPLPTIEEGWDIITVDAVSYIDPPNKDIEIRIIAIITLEPLSGRSSDYWQQPFVFDLHRDGKIDNNTSLNEKLSKAKPSIKTIKALKNYLKKISE